jgi:hypothetical protein
MENASELPVVPSKYPLSHSRMRPNSREVKVTTPMPRADRAMRLFSILIPLSEIGRTVSALA